jgi:hypothetical protein
MQPGQCRFIDSFRSSGGSLLVSSTFAAAESIIILTEEKQRVKREKSNFYSWNEPLSLSATVQAGAVWSPCRLSRRDAFGLLPPGACETLQITCSQLEYYSIGTASCRTTSNNQRRLLFSQREKRRSPVSS